MNPTFQNFAPLYDFSLIERGIQDFFVSLPGSVFNAPLDDDDPDREKWSAGPGNIAFYTALQALTFTKCRPRVAIGLHNVNHIRQAYALDANGNLREKAWQGSCRFWIVTEPNYKLHTQLRAKVLAIIPQVLGVITPDNSQFPITGINSLLKYHQVAEFWARDVSTSITPEEGNYQSEIPVELSFSVLPTVWPAGMQTV
jgi:hypothetical protein